MHIYKYIQEPSTRGLKREKKHSRTGSPKGVELPLLNVRQAGHLDLNTYKKNTVAVLFFLAFLSSLCLKSVSIRRQIKDVQSVN